jgi:hypothetical protein
MAAWRAAPLRLVRSWVAIVADLPPRTQTLLLVLWLTTTGLYALGLASVVVRARLAAVPVEEPRRSVIEQIVLDDPPLADPASAPSETPTAPAVATVAAPSPAVTPPRPLVARGALPPMPTLEATPTQDNRPLSTPTSPPPPTAAPRPAQPAAPPSTPAPRPPAPPAPPAAPAAGTLPPRGSFAKSEFAYPGDRSVYTVNLQIEPDDAGLLKNAGFIVYGPGGEEVVRGGAQPGMRPNVSANVITTRAGRYVVQVHNYDPGRAITYRLEVVAGRPTG